jgi:hypothetical protein
MIGPRKLNDHTFAIIPGTCPRDSGESCDGCKFAHEKFGADRPGRSIIQIGYGSLFFPNRAG